MIGRAETHVGGIYRNLEADSWRPEFHAAAAEGAYLERLKVHQDWRVHLFSYPELVTLPTGAFSSQDELNTFMIEADKVTGQHPTTATLGRVRAVNDLVVVFVDTEGRLESERARIATALQDEIGIDIRSRHPNGSLKRFDHNFAIGSRPRGSDDRVQELTSSLPRYAVRLKPVRAKLIAPENR